MVCNISFSVRDETSASVTTRSYLNGLTSDCLKENSAGGILLAGYSKFSHIEFSPLTESR
jgi:hypothetical protein